MNGDVQLGVSILGNWYIVPILNMEVLKFILFILSVLKSIISDLDIKMGC